MNTPYKEKLTPNELMQKLANAKKVMDKVNTGNYSEGNLDESLLSTAYDEAIDNIATNNINTNIEDINEIVQSAPRQNVNIDKINESRLPDAIKQAMIERPIQQVQMPSTNPSMLNNDIIKGARRLMEEDGSISNKKSSLPPRSTNRTPIYESNNNSGGINYIDAINLLKPLIENIIRESVDKIVDAKMEKLLEVQKYTSLNENLMIKVGDSIFKGNINGITNVKKK